VTPPALLPTHGRHAEKGVDVWCWSLLSVNYNSELTCKIAVVLSIFWLRFLIGFLPNPKPTILNISWKITYPNQKLKPFISGILNCLDRALWLRRRTLFDTQD